MRGLPERASEWGVMGLVVLGSAGIALWITGFTATPTTEPSSPPVRAAKAAEPFEARFPSKSDKAAAQPAPAWLMTGDSAQQQFAMWTALPASQPADTEDRQTPSADTGSIGSLSSAAGRRNADHRPTVFNDAQIVSIKRRLNLTKKQEQYWPAVEAELRRLAWKKQADQKGPGRRQLVALDVNSVDVAKLQSTTAPLLMSFNDEQKRELRMLAHLAGMQDLFTGL
jgi:hypothetical protein